jgi:hypothetical protein
MAIALLACAAAACSVGAPASYTQLVPGFEAPHAATQVAGATISSGHSNTPADCASRCGASECVGFTFDTATSNCTTHDWSPTFTLVAATVSTSYYPRIRARNTTGVTPAVEYTLSIPTSGVTLHSGPLKDAFEANLVYLLKFPVDDMLYWFRVRNGTASPPGANWGWDNGGPDKPYGLRVSRCTSCHPFRLCGACCCMVPHPARRSLVWCMVPHPCVRDTCTTRMPALCAPGTRAARLAIKRPHIHPIISNHTTHIRLYVVFAAHAFPTHHDDRGR